MPSTVRIARVVYCDNCRRDNRRREADYDAKTIAGPWAFLCEPCFDRLGVGLGTGKGQRLLVEAAAS